MEARAATTSGVGVARTAKVLPLRIDHLLATAGGHVGRGVPISRILELPDELLQDPVVGRNVLLARLPRADLVGDVIERANFLLVALPRHDTFRGTFFSSLLRLVTGALRAESSWIFKDVYTPVHIHTIVFTI